MLAGVIFVGARVYQFWRDGGLGSAGKAQTDNSLAALKGPALQSQRPLLTDTRGIVEKNLFDPERGTGQIQQADVSSGAVHQVQKMILLGTAIFGSSSYALFEEDSGEGRRRGARGSAGQENILRLKVGDTVEGFRLSEIHEKRVVFTRGPSRVELTLDFFRKIENGNKAAVAPRPPQRQPRQVTAPRPRAPQRAPAPPAQRP